MVPLADIFNHKASVVELAPGYEVHVADSDSDVEDNSGSEGGSGSEGRSEGGSGGESGSEEEAGSSSNGEEEDEQEGGRGSGGHHQHHHHGSCGAGCSHEHGSHAHGGGEGQPDGDGQDLPSVMGSGPAKIYGLTSGVCGGCPACFNASLPGLPLRRRHHLPRPHKKRFPA